MIKDNLLQVGTLVCWPLYSEEIGVITKFQKIDYTQLVDVYWPIGKIKQTYAFGRTTKPVFMENTGFLNFRNMTIFG